MIRPRPLSTRCRKTTQRNQHPRMSVTVPSTNRLPEEIVLAGEGDGDLGVETGAVVLRTIRCHPELSHAPTSRNRNAASGAGQSKSAGRVNAEAFEQSERSPRPPSRHAAR